MLLLGTAQEFQAEAPTPYRIVETTEFVPIIVDPWVATSRPQLPPRPMPTAPRKEESQVVVPKIGTSITGKASWYCKAGISICHHAYPAGSMAAAACGKLRRAMGPNWRGDIVTVTSGSRSVKVKLVDWCGSTDKLIDLYWEPMRRLGGSGVISVRVSW